MSVEFESQLRSATNLELLCGTLFPNTQKPIKVVNQIRI